MATFKAASIPELWQSESSPRLERNIFRPLKTRMVVEIPLDSKSSILLNLISLAELSSILMNIATAVVNKKIFTSISFAIKSTNVAMVRQSSGFNHPIIQIYNCFRDRQD
ncbi:hypothetical protein [Methylobacterium sp. WL120]|uniref:hypothetical protein n=1 Tax=Methylobacterium sp. WL120 TaxID=2603887 RepID=UPI0011CB7491|nr:hypothetical protein [Methylobacterium sp. WL120]TXM64420.1 hypothetical protein FV229_18730 [Methylobacterium sp. WL120]